VPRFSIVGVTALATAALVLATGGCDMTRGFNDGSVSENENDYYHAAKILISEARYAEAVTLLERASQMRGGADPEHDVDLAYCHMKLGDFSEGEERAAHYLRALDVARRAAVKRPDLADPRAIAGYVHNEMGQPSQAVSEYQAAVEIDPSRPRLHWNLGEAYRQLGSTQAAAEAYGEAARLDPGYLPRFLARLEKMGVAPPPEEEAPSPDEE
jgi:tetratricopeptide (TPR) repeat protein